MRKITFALLVLCVLAAQCPAVVADDIVWSIITATPPAQSAMPTPDATSVLLVMPTWTPDPTAAPQPRPVVLRQIQLNAVKASPKKDFSLYAGPGTGYALQATYARKTTVNAYQAESVNGALWVMAEIQVSGKRLRGYVEQERLRLSATLPMQEASAEQAVLCAPATAYRGPGDAYAAYPGVLPTGTSVMTYHVENGYVMTDVMLPDTFVTVRAWIAIEYIANCSTR